MNEAPRPPAVTAWERRHATRIVWALGVRCRVCMRRRQAGAMIPAQPPPGEPIPATGGRFICTACFDG